MKFHSGLFRDFYKHFLEKNMIFKYISNFLFRKLTINMHSFLGCVLNCQQVGSSMCSAEMQTNRIKASTLYNTQILLQSTYDHCSMNFYTSFEKAFKPCVFTADVLRIGLNCCSWAYYFSLIYCNLFLWLANVPNLGAFRSTVQILHDNTIHWN